MSDMSGRLKDFLKHPGTESDIVLGRKMTELALERAYLAGYRDGLEDGLRQARRKAEEIKETEGVG